MARPSSPRKDSLRRPMRHIGQSLSQETKGSSIEGLNSLKHDEDYEGH
jgi:hypothetical protein